MEDTISLGSFGSCNASLWIIKIERSNSDLSSNRFLPVAHLVPKTISPGGSGSGILQARVVEMKFYSNGFSSSSLGLSSLELDANRTSGSWVEEAEEPALSSIGELESPEDDCWPRRLRRIDVIRNDCRNDCRALSTVQNHEKQIDWKRIEQISKDNRSRWFVLIANNG